MFQSISYSATEHVFNDSEARLFYLKPHSLTEIADLAVSELTSLRVSRGAVAWRVGCIYQVHSLRT